MNTTRLRIVIALGTGTGFGICGALIGALILALLGGNPVTGMAIGGALLFTGAAALTWAVL